MFREADVDTAGGEGDVCWAWLVWVIDARRTRAAARPWGADGMELRSGIAKQIIGSVYYSMRRSRGAIRSGLLKVCLSPDGGVVSLWCGRTSAKCVRRGNERDSPWWRKWEEIGNGA